MRVLVTGASSGIGRAICKELRRTGGTSVGVARRPCPDADESISFDLSQNPTPELLSAIADADAAVFCAARGQHDLLVLEPEASVRTLIDFDLTVQLLLLRHCARLWMPRRHGQVVFVSSVAAQVGLPGLVAYSAAKAGVEAAARAAARELGRYGIRVNSIAPGFVATEMTSSLSPAQLDRIRRRTPLGRLATASEIAAAIVMLLNLDFVTGQTITVDGGFSL